MARTHFACITICAALFGLPICGKAASDPEHDMVQCATYANLAFARAPGTDVAFDNRLMADSNLGADSITEAFLGIGYLGTRFSGIMGAGKAAAAQQDARSLLATEAQSNDLSGAESFVKGCVNEYNELPANLRN